jgi:tetratricopeptide (TPR) repeat protein
MLVALFLWPAAVFGQSPELMDAYNRANDLSAEGRYQAAIPFAKKALRLSEREFGPNHSNTSSTLSYLALLYAAQGRYAEAEPLYKRALEIWEKALGTDHPNKVCAWCRASIA